MNLGQVASDSPISTFYPTTYSQLPRQGVASVSGDYTAQTTDDVILVDATLGVITISLPTAVGRSGKVYTVKKVGSGVLAITIDAAGTETIDGALTVAISVLNVALTLMSDGANWKLI